MRNERRPKKVLIMAGGTGGHVFPGLAVAEELRRRKYSVEWLGTRAGIENRLVPAADIPLHFSEISGVRGKGVLKLLGAPTRIYQAIKEAKRVLAEIQPDLVLGFGGFVAGPGGMAARMLKIPLVIHEQNAIAGTTNKLLARFAQKRLSGFEGALKRSEYVGNPVRENFEQIPPLEARANRDPEKLHLLVLGGSRGARALNQLVPPAIAKSSHKQNIVVRHQCGENWLAEVQQAYLDNALQVEVETFIDDVATALAWADLVFCRAGALTVAELSAVGVASVLVPFPYAIDDHQTANASFLEQAGAAIVKQQRDLSPEILAVLFNSLFADRHKLQEMAKAARSRAKTGVAKRISDICEQCIAQQNQSARGKAA